MLFSETVEVCIREVFELEKFGLEKFHLYIYLFTWVVWIYPNLGGHSPNFCPQYTISQCQLRMYNVRRKHTFCIKNGRYIIVGIDKFLFKIFLKKIFSFFHGQSLHNFSMFTYRNSYSTEFINNDNLKWSIVYLSETVKLCTVRLNLQTRDPSNEALDPSNEGFCGFIACRPTHFIIGYRFKAISHRLKYRPWCIRTKVDVYRSDRL